jgi:SAM-dependent MidA family methyltransferase
VTAERFTRWRAAAEDALYGSDGFFVREAPAAHFRTSVHTSPLYARAVATLVVRVDEALGHPCELTVADIGAGRGELLAGLLREVPAPLLARLRPVAVERAPRPPGLDARIAWRAGLPGPGAVTGLVLAGEWLDNVPLEVVQRDGDGVLRYVEVAADGGERLGAPVGDGPDADWLRRWWPPDGEPGTRAEVGSPRDAAWAAAVAALRRGLAVAVDYGHFRADRPLFGTLTGYRDGREVPPVPDGTCDLTAHVALDACADAARAACGGTTALRTQREALTALDVRAGRPPLTLASEDPAAYVRALAAASQAAELTSPAGLGAHLWLTHAVGLAQPPL